MNFANLELLAQLKISTVRSIWETIVTCVHAHCTQRASMHSQFIHYAGLVDFSLTYLELKHG